MKGVDYNTNIRSKKYKKARYSITDVSIKDLSNIIKEFEKFPYKCYVQKSPNHEPTDSYFYLARHIAKCMMRVDVLNSHVDPVRKEMTGKQQIWISHICDSYKKESKRYLRKNLISSMFYGRERIRKRYR